MEPRDPHQPGSKEAASVMLALILLGLAAALLLAALTPYLN